MPPSDHTPGAAAGQTVDTCPKSPVPPDPLVQAAMRDIPATLADMDNTGELCAQAASLGERVDEKGVARVRAVPQADTFP